MIHDRDNYTVASYMRSAQNDDGDDDDDDDDPSTRVGRPMFFGSKPAGSVHEYELANHDIIYARYTHDA